MRGTLYFYGPLENRYLVAHLALHESGLHTELCDYIGALMLQIYTESVVDDMALVLPRAVRVRPVGRYERGDCRYWSQHRERPTVACTASHCWWEMLPPPEENVFTVPGLICGLPYNHFLCTHAVVYHGEMLHIAGGILRMHPNYKSTRRPANRPRWMEVCVILGVFLLVYFLFFA